MGLSLQINEKYLYSLIIQRDEIIQRLKNLNEEIEEVNKIIKNKNI